MFETFPGWSTKTVACAIILLFLTSSLHVSCTSIKDSSSKVSFDMFLLVRTYSPTFCLHQQCTRHPIGFFTLHGLWPENYDGTWPEFCSNATTTTSSINTEEDVEMQCEWPSFEGTDAQFHNHEYTKHGTCAAPVIGGDEADYFSTALALHTQYDLNAPLAAAGLLPLDGRTVEVSSHDLKQILVDEYGLEPLLSCEGGTQISEIWMCLNKGLQPIQCPGKVGPKKLECRVPLVHLPAGTDDVSASCSRYFPHTLTSSSSGLWSRSVDAVEWLRNFLPSRGTQYRRGLAKPVVIL